jgi:hypothetical protein
LFVLSKHQQLSYTSRFYLETLMLQSVCKKMVIQSSNCEQHYKNTETSPQHARSFKNSARIIGPTSRTLSGHLWKIARSKRERETKLLMKFVDDTYFFLRKKKVGERDGRPLPAMDGGWPLPLSSGWIPSRLMSLRLLVRTPSAGSSGAAAPVRYRTLVYGGFGVMLLLRRSTTLRMQVGITVAASGDFVGLV